MDNSWQIHTVLKWLPLTVRLFSLWQWFQKVLKIPAFPVHNKILIQHLRHHFLTVLTLPLPQHENLDLTRYDENNFVSHRDKNCEW